MRNPVFPLFLMLLPVAVAAQVARSGEVTFLTSQHVYVKFISTEGIAVNDTLDLLKNGVATPCLLVSSMSSTSCVCTVIGDCRPEKQDRIQAGKLRTAAASKGPAERSKAARSAGAGRDSLGTSRERIRGRISAASYSNMPSARENDHRVMYRLSLTAANIANSKFSAETYVNYRKLYPADLEWRPQRTELLSVYNLALSYAPDSNTTIMLGRKINNSASSLGAIDGLQAERRFGGLFGGVIAGFRPDIYTYGLNTDLLQYGGYLGAQVNSRSIISRSTVGLMQQTNNGLVDRRYAYLQHSSTFKGNLNLFSTAELDLYSTQGGARLTNLFVSGRYRFGRKVDFFASYDSRRRVVFFETFRNEVEMLLDDDLARQGLRFRLNVRPTKALGLGGTYSRRFQADGANASDNFGLSVNLNRDPAGAGRWSVQANRNISNYLSSDALSFRHARSLVADRLTMSLYYRVLEYRYTSRPEGSLLAAQVSQRYYGADLTLTFAKTFTFMILGELSTILQERNYRLNLSLSKRFDSRSKR